MVLSEGLPSIKTIDIDEELFSKIGNGDMEALEKLYYESHKVLYAYIISMTKNHEMARDVLQETYVKVMAAAHLYQPMGKPLAWLFTISKRLWLNMMRKENRIIPLEDYKEEGGFSFVEDVEDKMVLELAFKNLSEIERQIVLLHGVSGMKHREIAVNLNMPLSTCLSKYRRALKKMKLVLEEVFKDEGRKNSQAFEK
jgi:RNA polymerase sigma-70 factor (ECF subfamily)